MSLLAKSIRINSRWIDRTTKHFFQSMVLRGATGLIEYLPDKIIKQGFQRQHNDEQKPRREDYPGIPDRAARVQVGLNRVNHIMRTDGNYNVCLNISGAHFKENYGMTMPFATDRSSLYIAGFPPIESRPLAHSPPFFAQARSVISKIGEKENIPKGSPSVLAIVKVVFERKSLYANHKYEPSQSKLVTDLGVVKKLKMFPDESSLYTLN